MLLLEHGLTLEDHLGALDGDHLSGVLLHEVLDPRLQHTSGKWTAEHTLQACFGHLDLVGQVENAQNVAVRLVPNAAKQRGHRQLLLPVDVRVHHAVDVGGEFNPRPFEWNDSRRVQLGAVGVAALAEEHTWRTVKLVHDDTLRAVHHERALGGHVRDGSQVHVLHDGLEVLVFRIGAVQLELGLQRDAVGQTPLQTFLNAVAGRIDEVIEKLENELIAGVRNGEVLTEHLEQSLRHPVFRIRFQLEKFLEGTELNVQEIRVLQGKSHAAKVGAQGVGVGVGQGHGRLVLSKVKQRVKVEC